MNSIVSEKKFIQERLGIPYDNLSQSYLRAETALTTLSTYQFNLQRGNVNVPVVTERLLNLNDQFVITHFTIGLKFIAAAAPTDAQQLSADVFTYVNNNVFVGNAQNSDAFYNSNLSFIIDRKEYLPNFPCRAFLRKPTTQQTAANNLQDGFDNGLYGFYPSEPTLIDGRQTLDISVNFGTAVTISAAAQFCSAVFEVRGYLVVNAKS